MSNQSFDDACFLCGQDSTYRHTDAANRRAYNCSNPDCGEYEISTRAMRRLENADDIKKEAMQKAKACRDTDMILVIEVSDDDALSIRCRPRN